MKELRKRTLYNSERDEQNRYKRKLGKNLFGITCIGLKEKYNRLDGVPIIVIIIVVVNNVQKKGRIRIIIIIIKGPFLFVVLLGYIFLKVLGVCLLACLPACLPA